MSEAEVVRHLLTEPSLRRAKSRATKRREEFWAEERRIARDERHETKAQACVCLVEALVELAPTVGTET